MSSAKNQRICGGCGSTNDPRFERCWLCQRRMKPPKPGSSPFEPSAALVRANQAAERSSLAASILLPGLVAIVCLGASLESPSLGAILALLAAPGLVRVWIGSVKARSAGQPMAGGKKVWTFAKTTFVTVSIAAGGLLVVAGVAFIAMVVAVLSFCGAL